MQESKNLEAAKKRYKFGTIWTLNDGKRLAVLGVEQQFFNIHIIFLNLETLEIENYNESKMLGKYAPKKTSKKIVISEQSNKTKKENKL